MVATAMTRETGGFFPPPAVRPTVDDDIALLREALRRAVLTLLAIPDPDKRYLRLIGNRWLMVRDAADAYGWTPEVASFAPTPRDVEIYLDVLSWLSWYGRTNDPLTAKLFVAWAAGASWRRLCSRFSASERTLRRWIDNMCITIYAAFRPAIEKIFVDSCPECPIKRDSTMYLADAVTADDIVSYSPSPTSWNAGGVLPSADTDIPAVAQARQQLIKRLQRQNRRRRKRWRAAKPRRR